MCYQFTQLLNLPMDSVLKQGNAIMRAIDQGKYLCRCDSLFFCPVMFFENKVADESCRSRSGRNSGTLLNTCRPHYRIMTYKSTSDRESGSVSVDVCPMISVGLVRIKPLSCLHEMERRAEMPVMFVTGTINA